MKQRQAKKEACYRTAILIETALEGGWPGEQYETDQEYKIVSTALVRLAEELRRRSAQ